MSYPMIAFIEARLAEEDHVAAAATPGPWTTFPEGDIAEWTIYGEKWTIASAKQYDREDWTSLSARLRVPSTVLRHANANAEHIALQDPRRTLGGVEAVWSILSDWKDEASNPDGGFRAGLYRALKHIVRKWEDHPDYQSEWHLS